jgi:hypothetical protein
MLDIAKNATKQGGRWLPLLFEKYGTFCRFLLSLNNGVMSLMFRHIMTSIERLLRI